MPGPDRVVVWPKNVQIYPLEGEMCTVCSGATV